MLISRRPDSLLHRLRRRMHWYPFQFTSTEFDVRGCKFEVTTAVEEYRVTSAGDEADFIRLMVNEVHESDILYDVGSCVGLVALHAAMRGARVVAFEPDPFYRERLKRNTLLNNLGTLILVDESAVSDRDGEAVLFVDDVHGNSASLACDSDRGSVTVQTISLDAALESGRLSAPTVIKLDIEGAEILALRGMRGLLNSPRAPRRLFVELHPAFLTRFDSSVAECLALLTSFQYEQSLCVPRGGQLHCIYSKRSS